VPPEFPVTNFALDRGFFAGTVRQSLATALNEARRDIEELIADVLG